MKLNKFKILKKEKEKEKERSFSSELTNHLFQIKHVRIAWLNDYRSVRIV